MQAEDYIAKTCISVLGILVGCVCMLGIVWLMIQVSLFFNLIPEVP